MNAAGRLGVYVAVLAVVFGGALAAGAAVDDDARSDEPADSADAAGTPVPDGVSVAAEGYRLVLDPPELVAGVEGELRVRVLDASGEPVDDLEPYLGAFGHLVALRADDLADAHVHPAAEADSAHGGPDVRFTVELPTAGTYRLFFEFQHDGAVHTAAFTVEARAEAAGGAQRPTEREESGEHGH